MFIVFEGIDGSGLTTQSKILKEYLEEKGKKVFLTKEPTDSHIGRLIRKTLKGSPTGGRSDSYIDLSMDQEALALLFAVDRSMHMDIIKRELEDSFVICDRYYFSNFAYQMLSIDLNYLIRINSRFLKPDLTIFLDVPSEVCKKRIDENREHIEIFENQETLERIRKNYLKIIKLFKKKGYNIVEIDGNRSIEETHADIVKCVEKFLE
ncbi:MAG TPA: dTMP kinase [Methanomicrobia archaeon]|nr:MAG: dTMP kinase [Thermococci archaeon]HDM22714.1 dTMP kinase [Methanomicrobia archaeon]